MRKTKGFTLVELVVVIAISSVILLAISMIFPYVLSTFEEQRGVLEFQKKSLIDTTYLLEKIAASKRFLPGFSSGSIQSGRNSYGYFLNTFDRKSLPFATIGLFSQSGTFIQDPNISHKMLGVSEGFLQSSFAEARGYIYFTEPGNHVVRRMTTSGTSIETPYGQMGVRGSSNTGTGTFNTPVGLSYDGTKYLYVSESGNHTIRRIDLDTNTISTFLGTSGISGYNNGETGASGTVFANVKLNAPLGVYATISTVYISDTFNNRIRKADISGGKVYTIAGSDSFGSNGDYFTTLTGGILNYPVGITGFSNGILIADSVNGKIRYLDETAHTMSTFVGIDLPNHANTYSNDIYEKLDYTTVVQYTGGKIYFNDVGNGILYKLSEGTDGIYGTPDDIVSKIIGDFDNNLMVNGDVEIPLSAVTSDIHFTSPPENIYTTSGANGAPKSGSAYLAVDGRGYYATGSLVFPASSNPSDGNLLTLGGITYEFDTDSAYTVGNSVIPLGSTFADTFDNLTTELKQNPSIVMTQSGSNGFFFRSKNPGTSGNGLILSGSGTTFTLVPSSGTLLGGADAGVGTLSFFTDKKLVDGKQYKLSFYSMAKTEATSDLFSPILEITSGGANPSYKSTKVGTSWTYNEYMFTGINPSGNDLQRIEFSVKKGNFMFFDNISLTALGTRESDQNIATFRVDILPSFFVRGTGFSVVDAFNRKLKYIDSSTGTISTPLPNFSLSDPFSLVLHGREDFVGNSSLEGLVFEYFTYNNLAPAKLQYSFSSGKSILKLVSNVAR